MQSRFRYRFLHAGVSFALLASPLLVQAQDTGISLRSTLVSMIVPLVLVVGSMILALVFVRRRFGIVSADGPMRVRQILAVGPRERVVLLDVEGDSVIIGVTSAQVSRIALIARARDSKGDANITHAG
jgi:flagellar biogenesis protein FliO